MLPILTQQENYINDIKNFRQEISKIQDLDINQRANNLLLEIKLTAEKIDDHILSTGPVSHSFLLDTRNYLTEKRIELTRLIKDFKRSQLI